MGAGPKNTPVQILQPVTASNGQGGRTVTYEVYGHTRWAEVKTTAGSEVLLSQQVMARVTRQVRLWWDEALAVMDTTWRVKWGSRTLQIQVIENVQERNRELVLHCLEIQGAAA